MNDEILEQLQTTEESLRDELSKVFDDGTEAADSPATNEPIEAPSKEVEAPDTPEAPAADSTQGSEVSTEVQESSGLSGSQEHTDAPPADADKGAEVSSPKAPKEVRINRKNEDIRNLLEAEKAVGQGVYEKLVASFKSAYPDAILKEELHRSFKPEKEPLKIFDIDELTGAQGYNESTGELEQIGGRINEQTGEVFTEDEAREFNARRRVYNEELKESNEKDFEAYYEETVSEIDQQLKDHASRAQEDQRQVSLFTRDNPIFDIDSGDKMPPKVKELTNQFWKGFFQSKVEEFMGTSFIQPHVDLYEEAQAFYDSHKADYYKALQDFYASHKKQASAASAVKGIAASSSKSASVRPVDPELEFARQLEQSLAQGISARKDRWG